ncbi:Peptide/nickel transport system permease protein [Hyphomicrobiales bacterium]|nr:Peptide/nickel transport system permease protein [Hyphomicrobiales bacterium]CAH1700488.1 Peptide/nickel transport system permease protein [Hyphomicrobiales bacterium]CAI0344338.1 peptide/nickel transport system permease protein [Hyphomicrobiales bacterium]
MSHTLAETAPRPRRIRSPALRSFLRNPVGIAGVALLVLILATALVGPLVYDGDPFDMVAQPFLWPGEDASHVLGTDSLGRDVAAGLIHGARVSLTVGIVATLIGVTVGVLVGAVAGYFGGLADDLLVRLIQLFHTMPSFVLLVVLVAIAQPSLTVVTIAIGLLGWPTLARLVRAEFRSLKQKDFVTAARSIGQGHGRIIFVAILPNALPPIIVASSVMVASAILAESALSFMGLGDPNVVSWGSMIGAGREFLRSAWYLTALPGLGIVATVLSLNLIGDSLNDALNPRLSRTEG